MDAVSEILKLVRLNGAVFFNAEFTCPWSFRSPHSRALARYLPAATEHIIEFHLVLSGSAWAALESVPGNRLQLQAGDIVVFPHGDPHLMGNGSGGELRDDEQNLGAILASGLDLVRLGGGGEPTRFVCGYMTCDRQLSRVVLGGLPPLFQVSLKGSESGRWLENAILFSVGKAASDDPGMDAVLAKLSEVLFVETIRLYMSSIPAGQTGWLAGARDADVGRALALLHRSPAKPWTVATLADEAHVSRSVLADKFRHYLGEPPIAYLIRWRLQLGARLLDTTTMSVGEIAMRVGYETEAAFNRAFKREFGLPPARYRKRQLEYHGRSTAAK